MNYQGQEIRIPVPWGHIAGKFWGNHNGRRILLLHGRQDNCGVFNNIVPLLRGSYYLIGIDLPGHGESSHFPPGIPLDFLNYLIAVYCVVEYVGWKKLNIIGHSLGGQIGIFFASVFQEYVEKLMVIDHVGPTNEDVAIHQVIKNHVLDFINYYKKIEIGKSPVYTFNKALEKLVNRDSVLTTEAAKTVLERSLTKIEDGFQFVMDQRLKLNASPLITREVLKNIISNVMCPMICIFSSERYQAYKDIFDFIFELLSNKSNYSEKVISGNHDVHQNHPSRIAPLIDDFFLEGFAKL